MRCLIAILFTFIVLMSCTDKLERERIQLSEQLLTNWDSASYLIIDSKFYCNQKIVYFSFIKDSINKYKYIYYFDNYIHTRQEYINPNNKAYSFDEDTVHQIIFIDPIFDKFITFHYLLKNGSWCYEGVYLGNGLIPHKLLIDEP